MKRARPSLGLRLVALCTAAVVTGCSGAAAPGMKESAESQSPGSRVSATFTQWPVQVGQQEGLLRVSNHSSASLEVVGVGLDLPRYGGTFVREEDTVLPPGRTIDFPLTLPPPHCDRPVWPIRAVVRTVDAELELALLSPGHVMLRRLGRQACDRQVVERAVSLRYAGDWSISGTGAAATVVGTLLLQRRQSESTVVVTRLAGSVLYDLTLGSRGKLAPEAMTARVGIRVRPLRCDEHARGQATAPFNFRATVRVDGRSARVPIVPAPKAWTRIDNLLGAVCRGER